MPEMRAYVDTTGNETPGMPGLQEQASARGEGRMIAYKLTMRDKTTFGGMLWGEGVTHEIPPSERSKTMCREGILHAYRDPLLATLLNPAHGNFKAPLLLWECRITKPIADDGLKIGTWKCTTIRTVPLPEITTAQRVRLAILCTKQVYDNQGWNAWADRWLDGTDRSRKSAAAAYAAAHAAAYAAHAAADAAAHAAAYAAHAAAYAAHAAHAAAYAADAAHAAYAASAATYAAAYAAAYAAHAAADAAADAATSAATSAKIDFVALAHRAVEEEK